MQSGQVAASKPQAPHSVDSFNRLPLVGLRGRVHAFRGMSLIVTYHPVFLLPDPRQKKEAWADLQIAMKEFGLRAPGRA